jgi:hypothetical protein
VIRRRAPGGRGGNALRIDWNDVLPAKECSYVMGNPPFVGHQWQSTEQQKDHDDVWEGVHQQAGRLDFVTGWYLRAYRYMTDAARGAFVSTNSITQGEQARILAAALWGHVLEIEFAHRSFDWTSEARGKAHVHVVIVGFDRVMPSRRFLVEYDSANEPVQSQATNINAYLLDGPNVVLDSRGSPLCPRRRVAAKC